MKKVIKKSGNHHLPCNPDRSGRISEFRRCGSGIKDKETSTDSSSILDDVDYDLTDETALLDENGQMAQPSRR